MRNGGCVCTGTWSYFLQRWNAITSALVAFITGGSVAPHCRAQLTSSPTRRATFANTVWLTPNAREEHGFCVPGTPGQLAPTIFSVTTDVSVSAATPRVRPLHALRSCSHAARCSRPLRCSRARCAARRTVHPSLPCHFLPRARTSLHAVHYSLAVLPLVCVTCATRSRHSSHALGPAAWCPRMLPPGAVHVRAFAHALRPRVRRACARPY